jgi:hypothetical protein
MPAADGISASRLAGLGASARRASRPAAGCAGGEFRPSRTGHDEDDCDHACKDGVSRVSLGHLWQYASRCPTDDRRKSDEPSGRPRRQSAPAPSCGGRAQPTLAERHRGSPVPRQVDRRGLRSRLTFRLAFRPPELPWCSAPRTVRLYTAGQRSTRASWVQPFCFWTIVSDPSASSPT